MTFKRVWEESVRLREPTGEESHRRWSLSDSDRWSKVRASPVAVVSPSRRGRRRTVYAGITEAEKGGEAQAG